MHVLTVAITNKLVDKNIQAHRDESGRNIFVHFKKLRSLFQNVMLIPKIIFLNIHSSEINQSKTFSE